MRRRKRLPLVLLLLAAALPTGFAAATGSEADEPARIKAPLLRYRLELARTGRTYFQVAPEAVGVYVRGIEMKRLEVTRHWRMRRRLLEMGRVVDWSPRLRDPMLLAGEDQPVDALFFLDSLVTLEKMPAAFSVQLDDGTLLQVSAAGSDGFHPDRSTLPLASADEPPPDVIRLEMAPGQARQLYWLLDEGLAVIF